MNYWNKLLSEVNYNIVDHCVCNHPSKSGHGLTNILTLDTGLAKLASCMFYYDNKITLT